jgi:hypothetical protein
MNMRLTTTKNAMLQRLEPLSNAVHAGFADQHVTTGKSRRFFILLLSEYRSS